GSTTPSLHSRSLRWSYAVFGREIALPGRHFSPATPDPGGTRAGARHCSGDEVARSHAFKNACGEVAATHNGMGFGTGTIRERLARLSRRPVVTRVAGAREATYPRERTEKSRGT